MRHTRAVILPVVLFVLLLIGLLAAMFAFRVHSDLAATQAATYRMQARLAAEAGVEWIKLYLRAGRFDRNLWYDNPDLFHRVVVWAYGRKAETAGTNEEFDETMVFRFSIVADDPSDDRDYVRFGVTDEAAKLNLNVATEAQLLLLVSAAVVDHEEIDPQAIVDAILDWRDSDSDARGESADTEGDYYAALEKPYAVKNGPFDTVEELLLIKDVTPQVLYGEDYDRNGLLTPNEKDGDLSFPDDNQDEVLNRGLYPYLTVASSEDNVSNSNRQRLYLGGPEATVRAELERMFPDDSATVDYIIAATRTSQGGGQGGGGQGGGVQTGGQGSGAGQDAQGGTRRPAGAGRQGSTGPRRGTSTVPPTSAAAEDGSEGALPPPTGGGKAGPRQQRRTPPTGGGQKPGQAAGSGSGAQPEGGAGSTDSATDDQGTAAAAGDADEAGEEDPGAPSTESGEEGQPSGEGAAGGGGGPGGASQAPKSPASLMLPRTIDGQLTNSPLTAEELAVLMDQTTMIPSEQRKIPGLININTAPRLVLECIDGLNADQIEAIIVKRETLDSTTLLTTAWLVSEGIVDVETFDRIAPQITARAQQFMIESLGYADHIGMVARVQVIVDMAGPIAQTIYYRDISGLGGSYPIREEDKERVRGR